MFPQKPIERMMSMTPMVVRPKISMTEEDPMSKSLGEHGMSKMAGCPDVLFGPIMDRTLGRYLTGLDEEHPDVLSLPQEERLAKQKEILEERQELERLLGHSLHYTNTEYWKNLKIVLDRGVVFNPKNPTHRVIIHVLKAGKILPTSKRDIGNPDYNGANFYLGGEFEDVSDRKEQRTKTRELHSTVKNVLADFDYAVELGTYLKIDGIDPKMPPDNLDDIISLWLEKGGSRPDEFVAAAKEPKEYIRLYNLFTKFKAMRLVKFEDGKWLSGKVKLGKTEREAVKKLLSANPEMQAELANLMEDYETKK